MTDDTDSRASGDIFDGIAQVRVAFLRAGLAAPAAILLASHDDGMKFLSEMAQTNLLFSMRVDRRLGIPVEMADGSIWMEVEVMAIKVRWPATRRANPDGSWRYE